MNHYCGGVKIVRLPLSLCVTVCVYTTIIKNHYNHNIVKQPPQLPGDSFAVHDPRPPPPIFSPLPPQAVGQKKIQLSSNLSHYFSFSRNIFFASFPKYKNFGFKMYISETGKLPLHLFFQYDFQFRHYKISFP